MRRRTENLHAYHRQNLGDEAKSPLAAAVDASASSQQVIAVPIEMP